MPSSYYSPGNSLTRPSSGRIKSGVQLLVDAVRAKSEGKLREALHEMQSNHQDGLNSIHPLTGRTALHEAIMAGQLDLARHLLDAGADPNIGHQAQGPPLLHTAAYGDLEAMKLLLEFNADMAAVDMEVRFELS